MNDRIVTEILVLSLAGLSGLVISLVGIGLHDIRTSLAKAHDKIEALEIHVGNIQTACDLRYRGETAKVGR